MTKPFISPLPALCVCVPLFFSAAVPARRTTTLKFALILDADALFNEDFFSAGNRNHSGLHMDTPHGMIFAPRLDPTDDSSICHRYLLTSQGLASEVSEWMLP